jgi:hypothetical protein
MIKGHDNVQLRKEYTAMENHSYQGSLDPLWNSTAMEAVHSYGNSQLPRLLRSALEFHSHGGRTQLWKFTATKAP